MLLHAIDHPAPSTVVLMCVSSLPAEVEARLTRFYLLSAALETKVSFGGSRRTSSIRESSPPLFPRRVADFSYLLSNLRNRKYNTILVENPVGAAEELKSAANKVFKCSFFPSLSPVLFSAFSLF